MEHPCKGNEFTWCRNWKEKSLLRRLDRVLCNKRWFEVTISSKVNVPATSISYHCPLDVALHQGLRRDPRPFKYFALWAKHETYNNLVKEAWRSELRGMELMCYSGS
ncbi:hypothetical protein LIER_10716 [Lithospermum erythrorhizon]|uniref:Uncharacterized protein n=1 Tax=Lithospermum erythrorhizon TaxID=34254 RepID=A0AAV3PLL8_LITER